ncbi:MAG: hypothetical protein QXU09_02295 [Thermoproteota archaeon]
MGKKADSGFVHKLKEYLLKRYKKPEIEKDRGGYDCYIETELFSKSLIGTDLKWRISGGGRYPQVEEDIEGNIFLWSPTAGEVPDIIFLSCELDKVRITNDEVDRVWEMILDKGNWEKLEKKYRGLIEWLRKADGLAKKATEKMGVETVFFIPDSSKEEGDRFYFVARFNSKGMSDEEKMKTIEKALNILEEIIKEL